ncbi:hypothetical protein [Pseudomonas laurylsulfatiphila]|uniref:hypothetical protein n=1 Tax=Pseudomonas laurylsulfatiphila TaxID=2011015 RepID=UPI00215F34A9|nr:hypothetical protein [Pseudomonas laurylsulfatiphila]UVM05734.1 hypothetical protein LOY25_03235 [Pseudomonas laurylsulfatiphila]
MASAVIINNQSNPGVAPKVGDTLQAGYNFNDADGDDESSTTIQWLRNGIAIIGATSNSYTALTADIGANLSVEITPRTDATSTDPSIGAPAISAPQVVAAAGPTDVGNFIAPSTMLRTWPDADSYCQSLGARLPTTAELVGLRSTYTSADGEMCTIYGWPVQPALCGAPTNGSYAHYWTSDSGGLLFGQPSRMIVDLSIPVTNGGTGRMPENTGGAILVTCIR